MLPPHLSVFFFFQAEDGIRDYKVTGVQTCALPISRVPWPCRARHALASSGGVSSRCCARRGGRGGGRKRCCGWWAWHGAASRAGRGSCQRSEEHTAELQSPCNLVSPLLLEKKKTNH